MVGTNTSAGFTYAPGALVNVRVRAIGHRVLVRACRQPPGTAVLAARKAEGSRQDFGDRITGAAAKQIMSQFIKAHL
ncbi:hypothetical protein ACFO4E_12785 [Nocardiopsis mangrovi]|uniref:Uncharacterized protein n=1 Tax=Nocardiopsis mangrovi TaxID=1179818 RepID=A0ABV9DWN5_9ACTN